MDFFHISFGTTHPNIAKMPDCIFWLNDFVPVLDHGLITFFLRFEVLTTKWKTIFTNKLQHICVLKMSVRYEPDIAHRTDPGFFSRYSARRFSLQITKT